MTGLEAKLADRRERQLSNQAKIEKALAEIGAGEADGTPTTEPRKRLTGVQQEAKVDKATVSTLLDRLRDPAAALSAVKARLAEPQAERGSAETAQKLKHGG